MAVLVERPAEKEDEEYEQHDHDDEGDPDPIEEVGSDRIFRVSL